jgi:hypothetical protein
MSRRAPPDRAAQNQQTIKNVLKLNCNKICADCKRNKRTGPTPLAPLWHISVPGDGDKLGMNLLTVILGRSAMGVMESGRVYLHPLLGHPQRHGHSYQQSQVSRFGLLDR